MKKLFSLHKNALTTHTNVGYTDNFMGVGDNGLIIKGILKDIYDDSSAYLDNKGYLHVKGVPNEGDNEETPVAPTPSEPVNGNYENGTFDSTTGSPSTSTTTCVRMVDFMEVTAGYEYTFTFTSNINYFRFYFYDASKNYIGRSDQIDNSISASTIIETGTRYIKIKFAAMSDIVDDALALAENVKITYVKSDSGGEESGGEESGGEESGDMLYSFGMLADTHIDGDGDDEAYSHSDFKNAIAFLNSKNVDFTCIAGDVGRDGTTSDYKYVKQYFALANHPIYCVKGNHDNYKSSSSTTSGYKAATGCENDFVKQINGDVFIFLSMLNKDYASGGLDSSKVSWLKTQLSTYKDKRKFLIYHMFIPGTCGNPNNLYWSPMSLSNTHCSNFAAAVKADPKLIFIHGHSHFLFNLESKYSNANYYHKSGECYHIHTPSCARPRDTAASTVYNKGEGYLVEVYANKVVFKGFDVTTKAFKSSYVYTINLAQ